jgi:hypothetical protein
MYCTALYCTVLYCEYPFNGYLLPAAQVMRSISYWIGLDSTQILKAQDTIYIKQGVENLTQISNYEEIRM